MTANETKNTCAIITKLIVKLTINRIKIIFTHLVPLVRRMGATGVVTYPINLSIH